MSSSKSRVVFTRFDPNTWCIINGLVRAQETEISKIVRTLVNRAIQSAYDTGVNILAAKTIKESRIRSITPETLEKITNEVKTQNKFNELVELGLSTGRPCIH